MSDAITPAQRTVFEQHIDDCIVSEAGLSQALKRDGFGDYTTPWVQSKYVAFLAALRAQPSQDADPNATWLSEAHMLCTDQGIAQGNITERIRALRDKLEQPSQPMELVNTQRVCFIRGWDARGMFSGPESSEERDMRMRELLDAYYPRAAIDAKDHPNG